MSINRIVNNNMQKEVELDIIHEACKKIVQDIQNKTGLSIEPEDIMKMYDQIIQDMKASRRSIGSSSEMCGVFDCLVVGTSTPERKSFSFTLGYRLPDNKWIQIYKSDLNLHDGWFHSYIPDEGKEWLQSQASKMAGSLEGILDL